MHPTTQHSQDARTQHSQNARMLVRSFLYCTAVEQTLHIVLIPTDSSTVVCKYSLVVQK